MTQAREEILARLRAARTKRGESVVIKPGFTSSVYLPLNENRVIEFKNKLEQAGGRFFFSKTLQEAIQTLKKLIEVNQWNHVFCIDPLLQSAMEKEFSIISEDEKIDQMSVGITTCEFLVAHLGAILISSGQASGRRMNVFPEIHVIFAHQYQLTDYLEDGLEQLAKKYNKQLPALISVITGPSRTADIEKTLIMGMHGPHSLLVFLCDEPF